MADSFIEHEKETTTNATSNNNEESGGNTNVKRSDLLNHSLFAAGDATISGFSTPKQDMTKEFINNESTVVELFPEGNEANSEVSVNIDEEEKALIPEESVGSGVASDVEDNVSDSELTLPEEPLKYDPTIDDNLPDTVQILRTPNGGKVYLIGTAHFSIESQEDVSKIIRAVQPHIVIVELCKARVNILQLDEKTILEEAKNINLDKIISTIKQNGVFRGIMYILLLSMSAHLTKTLGMAPGGEFRRAFAEVKKVPDCVIHLGDRPIQITIQRALSSLSWWQTFRLMWHLGTNNDPISKEEIERCKRKDLLEELLAEMTGEYPALSKVFVDERDIYLAYSFQVATSHSQPGPYPIRVVGVVGIGHVPGIVQNWGKVRPEDIPPIMELPPPSLSSKILKFSVKASLVGLLIWGCSKVLPVPKVLSDGVSSVKNIFQ